MENVAECIKALQQTAQTMGMTIRRIEISREDFRKLTDWARRQPGWLVAEPEWSHDHYHCLFQGIEVDAP